MKEPYTSKTAHFALEHATDKHTFSLVAAAVATSVINVASKKLLDNTSWGSVLEGVSGVSTVVLGSITLASMAINAINAWNSVERAQSTQDVMTPDDQKLLSYIIDTQTIKYEDRVSTLDLLSQKYGL